MVTVRRNQASLSQADWATFLSAIDALHGAGVAAPAYRAFVQVHVEAMSMGGMSWAVHTMPSMGVIGRNFLAWHRRFLLQFEQRLKQVEQSIAVPYWDWIAQPAIPGPLDLSAAALQQRWSVTRQWNAADMPTAAHLNVATNSMAFTQFQRRLELGPHAEVHIAIGGTMNSGSSPADPLFWLHHANIDRIWAAWQAQHPAAPPSNPNEVLQPPPLFNVKVSSVLDIAGLGYSYQ
jgi:tyrosinase